MPLTSWRPRSRRLRPVIIMGWAGWLLGYPDRARASDDEAIRLAEQLSHPLDLMVAYSSGPL